jgi:hypothetical protein
MKKTELIREINQALRDQGFKLSSQVRPDADTKSSYRDLQSKSRVEQIQNHKRYLQQCHSRIEPYLLNGTQLNPLNIDLELRVVEPYSLEEDIFRWWNFMWWSVPYQKAYGRQMRFVLWDKGHNAPFGIIGLQSPVLKMAVRDNHLKIPRQNLDSWVNKSMQAQRLGALPPYNSLIGGKMVALAMTSNELRQAYRDKYSDQKTEMMDRAIDPNLLFITTTSAFGRSSIYNRLSYFGQPVGESLGFTKGYGSFHIPESLYKEIANYLKRNNVDVSTTFGHGPSRKIKLLYTAFRMLKMPDYSAHNLKREFFLFSLANNLQGVIQKGEVPIFHDRPLKELTNFWKERWCVPRTERMSDWKDFDASEFHKKAEREIYRGLDK